MSQKLLLIGLAGGLGTLARYGLSGWVQGLAGGLSGGGFPWGTLSANATGCLLFGLVWELGGERAAISPETRTIILAGFMGAMTTFSTYMFETQQMLRDAQGVLALATFAIQNVVGLACIYLGGWIAKTF